MGEQREGTEMCESAVTRVVTGNLVDDTVVTAHGARRLPGLAGRPLPTARERLIAMPYAGNEYNSVRHL